ncbi:MAG: arylsulfatase [Lentisphaeraceae bacterium]|nr:arylsulfatase [Lentisphaeraceae bacterium]
MYKILIISLLFLGQAFAQDKPNVIYILADDLGYGDLGCYGQTILKTPHLDALAKNGMRFTRNYSGSTVCAPSRCTLLTGRHTGSSTIRGNGAALLKSTDFTIADLFKDAGYVTGNFGKWGIGHPPPADNPNKHGFDEFFGYVNMYHAHNFYPEFLIHNGKEVKLRNVTKDHFKDQSIEKKGRGVSKEKLDYAPDIIRDKMLNFIDENNDKPFFLLYTPNTPHANNEGNKWRRGMEVPHFDKFDKEDWPVEEKGFAKMILDLDNDIKNITDQLKKHKLLDNTLIIFSSDNGPHQEGLHEVDFFDSNGLKRGLKRDLFEGGVRVPMIAHWPGKVPAGIVNNSIVAFQDLMPTLAELLKVSAPKNDGTSMLPKLLGKTMNDINRTLYWEFGERGGKQGILKGNIKLIRYFGKNTRLELYDVDKDPQEKNNIITEFPELADSLLKKMISMTDSQNHFGK